MRGGLRVPENVTTFLDVLAVALVGAGFGVVTGALAGALAGALVGVGVGLTVAGVVVLAASVVSARLNRSTGGSESP